MSIHDLPTLLTDMHNPRPAQWLWDRGWRVILRQAQNVTDPDGASALTKKDGDVHPSFKQVGFKTGVWGVTYHEKDFLRDSTALREQVEKYGAEVVQMNAEMGLKNANPTGIIQGLRSYIGPKALNTLGAASGDNIFPIDYASFIGAGYDIVAQAYANIDPHAYDPAHCIYHARRAGIPLDRFHLMIETHPEGPNPLTGKQWVALWNKAKILTNDIQVFMAETGQDGDYLELEAITLRVETPPEPVPANPAERRAAMQKLSEAQIKDWRRQGHPESRIRKTRIGLADTILDLSDSALKNKLPSLDSLY